MLVSGLLFKKNVELLLMVVELIVDEFRVVEFRLQTEPVSPKKFIFPFTFNTLDLKYNNIKPLPPLPPWPSDKFIVLGTEPPPPPPPP